MAKLNLKKELIKTAKKEFESKIKPFKKEIDDCNGKIEFNESTMSFDITNIPDELKERINQTLKKR